MSSDACYVLSRHLANTFLNSPQLVPAGASALAVYPENPLDLPAEHLKASYGDETPALAIVPELAGLLGQAAVRNSHKGVKATWINLGQCRLPIQAHTTVQTGVSMCKQCACVHVLATKATASKEAPLQPSAGPTPSDALAAFRCLLGGVFGAGGAKKEDLLPGLQILVPGQSEGTQPKKGASAGSQPATTPSAPAAAPALPLLDAIGTTPASPSKQAGGAAPAVAAASAGPVEAQNNDKKPGEGKSLEDYEAETYAFLQNKKLMKRPAAAKAKAKGKAKAKAQTKGKAAPTPAGLSGVLKLGCKTCRGTSKGCKACRNPNYSGPRMNRQEWLALARKHGWKL